MTDKLSVADDWIEWNGGDESPVPLDTAVVVRHRDGWEQPEVKARPASYWRWSHANSHVDIIAYRLARERGL